MKQPPAEVLVFSFKTIFYNISQHNELTIYVHRRSPAYGGNLDVHGVMMRSENEPRLEAGRRLVRKEMDDNQHI